MKKITKNLMVAAVALLSSASCLAANNWDSSGAMVASSVYVQDSVVKAKSSSEDSFCVCISDHTRWCDRSGWKTVKECKGDIK